MSNDTKSLIGAILIAAISGISVGLTNGTITIPTGDLWLVPVVVAVIAAATPKLERVFGSSQPEPQPTPTDSPANPAPTG